jgi:hypothetical protein
MRGYCIVTVAGEEAEEVEKAQEGEETPGQGGEKAHHVVHCDWGPWDPESQSRAAVRVGAICWNSGLGK